MTLKSVASCSGHPASKSCYSGTQPIGSRMRSLKWRYAWSQSRAARERCWNSESGAEGRLEIKLASAGQLPFPDATFTAADMTGVLGFLPDPLAAFREIHRVLRPGGRFVALGSDPALHGTPAAPEPIASRLH